VYSVDFGGRLDRVINAKRDRPVTLEGLDQRRFPVVLRDAAVRLLLPYL